MRRTWLKLEVWIWSGVVKQQARTAPLNSLPIDFKGYMLINTPTSDALEKSSPWLSNVMMMTSQHQPAIFIQKMKLELLMVTLIIQDHTLTSVTTTSKYILDVLWCQPIKLIQVVSTSEFHEYWWNDIDFIFFRPLHLLQGLRSNNIM